MKENKEVISILDDLIETLKMGRKGLNKLLKA
jgi:hypothetical protein